jgi:hypothetical protein
VSFDAKKAAADAMGGATEEGQSKWLDTETQDAFRRLKANRAAKEQLEEEDAATERALHPDGRWVNLDEFLDGEYIEPEADLGGTRDDGVHFLYSGRWHTLVGLTTAGKTFMALWHCKVVMETGGHVIYVHFEEPNPAGTLARLRKMGVDKETLRKQFHWPENRPWTRGEMTREIERLSDLPALAVLDGINAACGDHGWKVGEAESVGAYRATFVAPLTEVGCAVLSLGHPVKDPKRQNESYSYGAAGWLNDVDGASYKLTAVRDRPIARGKSGASNLVCVKDRYGNVSNRGNLQEGADLPQYYMGQFQVNDHNAFGGEGRQEIGVSVPPRDEHGNGKDKYDLLGDKVKWFLRQHGTPAGDRKCGFPGKNQLTRSMRAHGETVPQNDLDTALERLVIRGELEWPRLPEDAKRGTARPGWLVYDEDPLKGFQFNPGEEY